MEAAVKAAVKAVRNTILISGPVDQIEMGLPGFECEVQSKRVLWLYIGRMGKSASVPDVVKTF